MKFTKKEIKHMKWRFDTIKNRLEVNKIYENKKAIPEFIKINLIKYGICAGRIIETIYRRIDFKDDEKNLNADELIKELFGEEFYKWICGGHEKFIYGHNHNINNNNTINDIINS